MNHHQIAVFLTLLWMAPGVGASAADCTRATLLELDPGFGEVLTREDLPDTRTRITEEAVGQDEAPCEKGETDDACRQRVEGLSQHLPREGQSLRVTIESDTRRVRAVLIEEGPQTEHFFPSFDALADYMEERIEAGQQVVLFTAGEVPDPATRKAVITFYEEHTDIATVGPGMKLTIRNDMAHLDALTKLEAVAGGHHITVINWAANEDGMVVVDLRCPGP